MDMMFQVVEILGLVFGFMWVITMLGLLLHALFGGMQKYLYKLWRG